MKKLFLVFLIVPILCFSQSNSFKETIKNKLSQYAIYHPEKIYIHTDKPYYSIGDDIWFSLYLVNGITHEKTNKSRIVYVELIDEQNTIVSKKQFYVEDVSVAGDFSIDKTWEEGKYYIRAYTNYMRNQDSDYFFKKEIQIWKINLEETIVESSEDTSKEESYIKNLDVNFFPEGGYLINDINSKIGIKIKNIGDQTIEGIIRNSDNDTITFFRTFDFGLGVVNLTPRPNKTYHALVSINNQEFTYELPKALTQGYHLYIENKGDEIFVIATSNTPNGLKGSYLLVHQRGQLVTQVIETKAKKSYTIKLDANTLLDGVTTFVLFDNNGHPTAERLVFINNQTNDVEINLDMNPIFPENREKIDLEINLKDQFGNPVSGNLSMAITDLNVVENDLTAENIKTYLLINSDLRGQIKNPGYFFEDEKDLKRRYLLDLVMLTHGWRRFKWNSISNSNTTKNQFKPEKGLYVSGFTSKLSKTGVRIPAETRLTFPGYEMFQERKKADKNGNFKYGPYMIMDSFPALVEARVSTFSNKDIKNRNVAIHINKKRSYSPPINNSFKYDEHSRNKDIISNYLRQSKLSNEIDAKYLESARLLEEVLVVAKVKSDREKRDEMLNELADYGYPTKRLDLNNIPNSEFSSVFNLLRRIPNVNVFNDSITLRNRAPRIIVDGLTYESADVAHLTGQDVEFIDVLEGADASYFSNSGNGVIVIHLKSGVTTLTDNIKRKPGIVDFMVHGFYTAKEFYSPNYLDDFDNVNRQDIRSTLYWHPKLKIDKTNPKSKLSFFTSDTKSTYGITIEGITESGLPILHYSTFSVE